MTQTERPLVCRACREAMPDINWNNPCPHWKETPQYVARMENTINALIATSRGDADEIERLTAELADYKARHETSLEVIRAREQEAERQRVEIERLRAEVGRLYDSSVLHDQRSLAAFLR